MFRGPGRKEISQCLLDCRVAPHMLCWTSLSYLDKFHDAVISKIS